VLREVENVLRKIYEIVEKIYSEDVKIDYKKYLEKFGISNLIHNQQGNGTFLIDVKQLKMLRMEDNICNHASLNIKNFRHDYISKFVSRLVPKHLSFITTFISWVLNILKTLPIEYKTKYFISVWGLKLYHKNQQIIRFYLNFIPLEFNKEGNPTLFFLSIQEITHLIKGDDYFIRGSFGETNKKVFVYYSNEDKTVKNDIISERERKVLQYISQGLNTKQIADFMNISSNTVDNHRRNMLARTGTRDTTALIQLCRMMGVL
jgi:DNA-binding CsgD family transcriptional regulator